MFEEDVAEGAAQGGEEVWALVEVVGGGFFVDACPDGGGSGDEHLVALFEEGGEVGVSEVKDIDDLDVLVGLEVLQCLGDIACCGVVAISEAGCEDEDHE